MKWSAYPLVGLCVPWMFTVSLPLLFLLQLLRLVHDVRLLPSGVVIATFTLRATRYWRFSTTLGRVVFLQPLADTETLEHELVHVRQHEDLVFIAWQLSVLLGPFFDGLWGPALLWWSAGLWQLFMYLTAALRYGWRRSYLDAEHERAAYAQTEREVPQELLSYGCWLKRHEARMECE